MLHSFEFRDSQVPATIGTRLPPEKSVQKWSFQCHKTFGSAWCILLLHVFAKQSLSGIFCHHLTNLHQIQRLWTANAFEAWEQLKGKRRPLPELMVTGLRLYSSIYLRCFVAVLGSGPVRRLQLRADWSWNMKRFYRYFLALHRTGSFEYLWIPLTL